MTYRTGLLGWPLGHSVSPAMHNAAFQELGLDGRYDALPTPSERLATTVAGLAAAGYRGVNVTIPHKQAVMPLLDELSPAVQAIGAVNTIIVGPVNGIHRLNAQRPLRAWETDDVPAPEGASHFSPASPAPEGALCSQPGISIPGTATLRGDNTDWLGFLHPLDARGVDLAGKTALLLGAGGSARAVVYALLRRGLAHLSIWARNPARAAELAQHAESLAPSLTIHQLTNSPFPISHPPDLIINTTPLGMWPHIDVSPWPADLPMPSGALVYDLVYRPERTRFLQQAEAAGCATQGGLEMLVVQGAAAFELWTGQPPPLEVMMTAARAALATA
ncbi:MAG TPA: shikimate dehydrogenase [Anaerolineae bacterium]|nr:shikimate dehydrogenase [Anaerolineae bacterium]